MKKIMAVMLSLLACTVLLAGCKDWKDSFGLSVEEHKKALETNLTDGYIEFSATR